MRRNAKGKPGRTGALIKCDDGRLTEVTGHDRRSDTRVRRVIPPFRKLFNDRAIDGTGTVALPIPTNGTNAACLTAKGSNNVD
jgi:hypothetical protein